MYSVGVRDAYFPSLRVSACWVMERMESVHHEKLNQMEKVWLPLWSLQLLLLMSLLFHHCYYKKSMLFPPLGNIKEKKKLDPLTKHLIAWAIWNVRHQIQHEALTFQYWMLPNNQQGTADINTCIVLCCFYEYNKLSWMMDIL